MLRIAAELKDVPLRKAQVFEQHPGSVREVRDLYSGQLYWPVADSVVETGVSPTVAKQVEQVLAQGFVARVGWLDCLGNTLSAGAFLLHGSPCCFDGAGAMVVATGAVSGASPRY